MCGISGCVGGPSARAEVVDEQLRRLHHRGPDACGAFTQPGAIVAQNRLAVIDLQTGDPPVTNEDGSVGASLNGEIYNFRTLRTRLELGGHTLRTQGDTEVIAHLAENLEPVEIARALDGMFAFAVWDARRERLVLGRDRTGKKPLYYAHRDDGTFVFASEIKGVLAHPSVPHELDPRAIPAYLTFGYVPTPDTFFAGVHSVPPGHVLVLERDGTPELSAYWEPPLPGVGGVEHLDLSPRDAALRVRATLDDAVRRRLISDVPLGAFLSGGIDSSAIVALMARHSDGRPVRTFTIGFDDRDGFDERPYARSVAARYGTAHHEEVVAPDAVDLVDRLVWHHDQPFGDSSAVPTYLLCEVTRRDVTVALSGDGGDELFAGYERFAAALALRRLGLLPRAAQDVARRALMARGGRVARFAAPAGRDLPDAYVAWLSFADEELRDALLDGRGEGDDRALDDYRRIWSSTEGAQPLDRLLNLNLRTYLVDDLLVKADRMSMAHGLEVRSPFLDTELVELALRLRPSLKVRGMSLKRVLRAAVADLLPDEILRRPKRGFGVPLDRWFREDLGDYVRATLGASDARVKAHLAAGPVDWLIAHHMAGRGDHGQALWMLLTLELFLRREGW